MIRLLFTVLILGFSLSANAFPCFLTLVKDSCWTNYNVTVVVTNAGTGDAIVTATVPKGKSWVRVPFTCQPAQALSFSATFSPVFWQDDTYKTYPSQHNWYLPETVKAGATAWSLTLCYPSEFSEVPLPPDASGNCGCQTDNIPPVKPQ